MSYQLSNFEGSGIFVTWERITPLSAGTVDHYRILRSTHRDGTYTSVATVDVPINEYVDTAAAADISSYYTIQEESAADAVIATHAPQWGESLLLRASLFYEMMPFLQVPVYQELLRFTDDTRSVAHAASWGAWNYWDRPELEISYQSTEGSDSRTPLKKLNQGILYSSVDTAGDSTAEYSELKWNLDYNGKVYFIDSSGDPVSIKWYDNIYATYNFQAFSYTELNDALFLAAAGVVAQPGVNKTARAESPRSIGDLPRRWDHALVFGASWILIRRLALMLTQRERRLVFVHPNDPQGYDPVANLTTLMTSYKEQYEDAKEKIAKEVWPTVGVNLTQEFMMPGQRNRFFRLSFKGY